MSRVLPRVLNGGNLWVLPAVLGVIVLFGPQLGISISNLRQMMLIAILALVASGLCLAWGYGGELAVGQVAMYAAGAYAAGILAVHGWDMAYTIVAGALAAAVLGLVTGIPAMRVGGWGFAMASFFLVLLIPQIVQLFKDQTGGLDGLLGVPPPVLFGHQLSFNGFFAVIMLLLFAWLAFMRNLVTTRHGSALRVMRESPVLASSIGLSVTRLKLTAYVVGAVPAGIAGALFVYINRYLAPSSFDFTGAVLIIAAAVLGSLETVYGVVVAAAILTIGTTQVGAFDQYAAIAWGALLVIGGGLLTNPRVRSALADMRRRARSWRVPRAASAATPADVPPLNGPTLSVESLSKSFGGTKALKNVSMVAKPGQITGLIGANGSGKTTLLNVASGYYRADGGTLALDGVRIPNGKPARIARRGIARTFQTPLIPQSMTTAEVVEVARYSHDRCGMISAALRLPKFRRVRRRDHDEANVWLSAIGLSDVSNELASSLPLGSRRLVEVARALATGGTVLLLDEPASGLDHADLEAFGSLLRRVRNAGATIVLVEHNFSLVCDLADTIYVLERGDLIAHGTPDEIRNDDAVSRSYLGQVTAPDAGVEDLVAVSDDERR